MSEDVVRALEGIYASVERAFQNGDLDSIDAMLAPDFVAYDQHGHPQPRAEVMAGFAEMIRTLKDIAWPRRILEVRFEDERAIATAAGVFSATRLDGGKVELDIVAEDVWVQTEAGWQSRAARSLKHEDRSSVVSR